MRQGMVIMRLGMIIKVLICATAISATAGCSLVREAPLDPYLSTTSYRPHYEYNIKRFNDRAIRRQKSHLEKVPDMMQRIVNAKGGKIVFFDGRLTDNPELRHLSGQRAYTHINITYDRLPGLFLEYTDPKTKHRVRKAFLKQNHNHYQVVGSGSHRFENINLELHEYGHLFDSAMGRISQTPAFTRHCPRGVNPSEFFADRFAQFYDCRVSRDDLRYEHSGVYEYFIELERHLLLKTRTSAERAAFRPLENPQL
jgi:hypothetical protein